MQTSSQQVVLMGVFGLIVAVVLLVYMFLLLFNGSDTPNATLDADMSSSSLITTVSDSRDTSWQQEFVMIEASAMDVMTQAEYDASSNASESETSKNNDASIGFQVTSPMSGQRESPIISPNEPSSAAVETKPIVPTPTYNLPSLSLSGAQDCGAVVLPEASFGIFNFIATAGTEPAVICLGEAIGNSCQTASFTLGTEANSQRVYTTSRAAHTCSIGLTESSNSVVLCDVMAMVDFLATDTALSWSEVEAQFKANPGGMMSLLIQGNFLDLQRGETESLGCIPYSFR